MIEPSPAVRLRQVSNVCGFTNRTEMSGCACLLAASIRFTQASISVVVNASSNSTLSIATIWLGPIWTVNTPFADVFRHRFRQYPTAIHARRAPPVHRSECLRLRANSSDDAASTAPIPSDATASSRGMCSSCAPAIPANAISKPINAVLSSNSTVNVIASLLRRNARNNQACLWPHETSSTRSTRKPLRRQTRLRLRRS